MSMTGDVQTMQERVLNELDRPRAVDGDIALTCIIDSIEEYRWHPFHWNTNFVGGTIAADANTLDVLSTVPDFLSVLEFWIANVSTVRNSQVFECGMSEFRVVSDRNSGYKGRPINMIYHGQVLEFDRVLDEDYTFVMDYIKDIGTPSYNFDSGEQQWEFLDPSGAALPADYTSSWFTYADELIRSSSKRRIYESYLKDQEAASNSMQLEQRALERLGTIFRTRPPRRTNWRA